MMTFLCLSLFCLALLLALAWDAPLVDEHEQIITDEQAADAAEPYARFEQ